MTAPRLKPLALFTAAIALAMPVTALAQSKASGTSTTRPSNRGAIAINGSYQGGSSDVTSTVGFTANAERATFQYKFPVKPGTALDVSARYTVRKNLGVSVGYTSFSAGRSADVTGQIPHPFFFNQPRTISGTASLERKETAVHLRATLSSRPGKRLQFTASAGPAFFSITQTLIDAVSYTDAYPFDTATFSSATTRRVSKSKTGVGAAVDIAYYVSKHLGVGAIVSVAKASITAKAADDSSVAISAGGSALGLGLRLRF